MMTKAKIIGYTLRTAVAMEAKVLIAHQLTEQGFITIFHSSFLHIQKDNETSRVIDCKESRSTFI